MEQKLCERIKENPLDAMAYYYLGKEMLKRPLKDIDSISEIEDLFKKSIELNPNLWAPKILLGELLYKVGRYKEAEVYFRGSLKKIPNNGSIKEYLAKRISKSSKIYVYDNEFSKEDSLYLFENNVREFIRILLEENFRENWWREGIPKQVRAKCASRREEALDEEKEADLLLFADFFDYKMIIESNKNIFASYVDIKEWGKQLNSMEPIRNAIAHNRPLSEAPIIVRDCNIKFQKIIEKVKNKSS